MDSELTFKDLIDSKFGGYTRVIWNGKIIFEDKDDGTYVNGQLLTPSAFKTTQEILLDFLGKWYDKKIYSFYCRVVHLHHTELYIEGE